MTAFRFPLPLAIAGACLVAACSGNGSNGTQATAYVATALVSDGSVPAAKIDPNLSNPWGIAFEPPGGGGGPGSVWVADNNSNVSTLYDGNGNIQSLVVNIPPSNDSQQANPTGIVLNTTSDFAISENGTSAPAEFIFDGEGGTISGWAPNVDLTHAITVVDGGANGVVYKGLALASNGGANFIYATDFRDAKVEVFDRNFALVASAGGFNDPNIPAGFAPFGIQNVNGMLYVTYAQQDASKHDNNNGPGLGYVDLYDTAGNLVKRLVSQGALNAPWGIALAPNDFGQFSNALLVGNFGDGVINAYDPTSGQALGSLSRSDGSQITAPGLWGLAFGNGLLSQPTNVLYFAAGLNNETNGLYGSIAVSNTSQGSGTGGGTNYGG